jgi:hypothetical protein
MTLLLNGSLGGDSEDSLLERLDERALERVARESSIASASSFVSLGFSSSSDFRGLAFETSRPPYPAFHL